MINNSLVHVEQCPRDRERHRTVKDEIFISQKQSLPSCTGGLGGTCLWIPIKGVSSSQENALGCWVVWIIFYAKEQLLSNQQHQQVKHDDDSIDKPPNTHPPKSLLTWLFWKGECRTGQGWMPSRCVCPLGLWFKAQISWHERSHWSLFQHLTEIRTSPVSLLLFVKQMEMTAPCHGGF